MTRQASLTRKQGSVRAQVLLDTSVAVPLVVKGHRAHQVVIDAVADRRPGLAGHAWFETFSVLTRLPPPVRRSPGEVGRILRHNFPDSRFLSAAATEELVQKLTGSSIAGGAIYDALVAHAAVTHDLPLLSRDKRTLATYRTIGASVEIVLDSPTD